MKNLLAAIVLWSLAGWGWADTALEAKEGWVRWVPPVSQNSAAYFTLHNHGDKTATLVSASSDVAAAVEIHNVVKQGEVMSMQKQDKVEVGSHKSVQFQPGAYHVMLIGLKKPLLEREAVILTLHFADGASLNVPLTVSKDPGQSGNDADHQHHHHH